MARFQKLAVAALASLLLLIFVGAIVRVSGAGMGCPDWPTCWGCLVPPTKLEDVDFAKLEAKLDKFKAKAAREGRDPDSITLESLRAEFNPLKAWIEYINRLSSAPVAVFTFLLLFVSLLQRNIDSRARTAGWILVGLLLMPLIVGFAKWDWRIAKVSLWLFAIILPTCYLVFRRGREWVLWTAHTSVVILLANAWMGARIVHSGLKPGIITTHLALAMLMLGALTYCAWRGTDTPWRADVSSRAAGRLRFALGVLLLVVVAEGILGSQIREITDEMAKAHHLAPRTEWIGELEKTWLYVVHRSFSWAVLAATLWAYWLAKRNGSPGRVGNSVLGIVLGQMVLGLIMSQVHLYAWVQVLHVGLASVLLALIWLWLFGVSRSSGRN